MVQTRRQVWVEIILVALTLALGGMLLYALLPFVTAPDQQVVPPPRPMDTTQTLLVLFFVATAIGAPVTIGIVLAIVFKVASKRVPASSSVAPEIPTAKPKARAASEQPREMSPGEALKWKISATVLLLLVGAGAVAGLLALFAQYYK